MSIEADTVTARVRQAEVRDRWLFWGLIGALFWAPLPLGSNRTWAIGILVGWSQVLLLGTIFAWRHEVDAAFARLRLFRWPVGVLAAFGFLVWAQLLPLPAALLGVLSPEALAVEAGVSSLQLSLDPDVSRLYAAASFAYLSFFLVALLTVRSARRLDRLAYALVLSGLFQAIVGVFLFSVGAKYRIFFFDVVHGNVLGTYGNRNHFAGYMEICLSVGIGLMLARLGSDRPRDWSTWRDKLAGSLEFMLSPKMRLRMMLVVMVIALVLTRSRMGNSGFFAAMLIVGVLSIALSRKLAPATVALIASLVVIDVVIVGTWVGLEKVVERVKETSISEEGGGREESVELRQAAAMHAVDLVRDFPVFGTGGGSFYNAYLRYRTPREGYFDHAHNDYAEFAADYGLLGLALIGSFVLLSAGCAVRVLLRRRSSLPRGIAFGSLMAMVALAVHSAVDFNLQIPANAMTMVIVIAMAWIASELPAGAAVEAPRSARPRPRRHGEMDSHPLAGERT